MLTASCVSSNCFSKCFILFSNFFTAFKTFLYFILGRDLFFSYNVKINFSSVYVRFSPLR